MCQFIETVCYQKGQWLHIGSHNARLNKTRNQFFSNPQDLDLEKILEIPLPLKDQTVKCRITYGEEILSIEYDLYTIRPVRSLQLIVDDSIEYDFKYADRTNLNDLYAKRGQCDDILIVKNGFITDSSYANIIFKKSDQWYSPQYPLLQGTRLQGYLSEGRVTPVPLRSEDLYQYSEARLINAMMSIEDAPIIPIDQIIS